MNYLLRIWKSKSLRNKILFTIFIVFVFRLTSHITLPGIDIKMLESIFGAGGSAENTAVGTLSKLMGGSMERFSIVMMGLSPYINASIIMQLMTVAIPKLEAISKEGDQGRKKINSYTRWLSFPLAILQSYGMIALFSTNIGPIAKAKGVAFIDPTVFSYELFAAMITISAGTIFIMWLGELITEKGIGNGISILIFAGIVSAMPGVFSNMLQSEDTKIQAMILFAIVTVLLLVAVVLFTEGQRAIPLNTTSRTAKGQKSILPIRILQAGMIPIIFSISMITFPGILADLLPKIVDNQPDWLISFSSFWKTYFSSQQMSWPNSVPYLVTYFALILAFTYFYVSITFKPESMAENLQKRGGFIPGIRPGNETAGYLAKVSNRMNLWGGTFLGLVALTPLFFAIFTELTTADFLISGSGLIIVVGVVLELIRQVNAQLVSHNYEKLT